MRRFTTAFVTVLTLAAVVGIVPSVRAPAYGRDTAPSEFTFAEVAAQAGLSALTTYGGKTSNKYLLETTGSGVAAIDYDADGWSDLFFVNGTTLEGFPKGTEPTAHLYRNRGNGTFEDVTMKAGVALTGWGQAACAGDYDNDGYPDLYVTFWGQNRMLHNMGDGTFVDVTSASGLATRQRWGAGCAFIDVDRDGLLDVCGELYRSRSQDRTGSGIWPMSLQRVASLRSAGTDRREERSLSKPGQGPVRGRVRRR
jgi:hypothetical protein